MNTPAKAVAVKKGGEKQSLVTLFASKLGVEPEKMLATLRATAFRSSPKDPPVTNEEMLGLLVVAHHYNLNPFLKEIYAFRDRKGGIVPIVGVDGWIRLMQAQPQFAGVAFNFSGEDDEQDPWIECVIKRRDLGDPIIIREYHKECVRDTDPWAKTPRRMLRHRALIQCIRVAFGFGGIYEPDEGEVIALAQGLDLLPMNKPVTQPASAKTAEDASVTDDQIEQIKETLAKTGVPDNLVLARFECGTFDELKFHQVPDVLKFIQDNAP